MSAVGTVATSLSVAAVSASLAFGAARAAPLPSTDATTTYHRITIEGVGIFYREAGPAGAPTIVLLHGFPSSSREFETLIPLLATTYHVVAPDYPGFGLSDAPPPEIYGYTFDHLARTISGLLDALGITRYSLYLHDYGAPIGLRIILAHPDRLHALVIQNGNIYRAGLGPAWTRIAEYWADPATHPAVLDAFLSFATTRERHLAGTSHPDRYDPDSWMSEYAHLSQPGQRAIQGDLRATFCTTTGPTSPPTRSGRPDSARIDRPPSWSGASTTRRSSRSGRRPSGGTCRTRRSIFSMPDTSRSTKKRTGSPR